MRTDKFYANTAYHVSSSAIGEVDLFIDDSDYVRFIFLATHLQSPVRVYNVFWYVNSFIKKGVFPTGEKKRGEILKNQSIGLLAFSLSKKSFDLLIENLGDSMLSVYMHRLLTGYSKYYNAKYNRSGHLFNTVFRSNHIKNNNDLLNTSAIIHTKAFGEIINNKSESREYPWSSYADYLGHNRWGKLLNRDRILNLFKNPSDYKKFVSEYSPKNNSDMFTD